MTARRPTGAGAAFTAAAALLALRWTLGGRRRDRDDAGREDGANEDQAETSHSGAALAVVYLASFLFVAAAVLSVFLAFGGFVGDRWWDAAGQEASLVVATGSAERGRAAILAYECRVCHAVPGMPDLAQVNVGPPLDGVSGRAYIAGVLPNQPQNLVSWIMDPPRHSPETAMPDMGIDEATAADIAAYLYQH